MDVAVTVDASAGGLERVVDHRRRRRIERHGHVAAAERAALRGRCRCGSGRSDRGDTSTAFGPTTVWTTWRGGAQPLPDRERGEAAQAVARDLARQSVGVHEAERRRRPARAACSTTPSPPMPRWRSHRRRVHAERSAGASSSATRMKSLPEAVRLREPHRRGFLLRDRAPGAGTWRRRAPPGRRSPTGSSARRRPSCGRGRGRWRGRPRGPPRAPAGTSAGTAVPGSSDEPRPGRAHVLAAVEARLRRRRRGTGPSQTRSPTTAPSRPAARPLCARRPLERIDAAGGRRGEQHRVDGEERRERHRDHRARRQPLARALEASRPRRGSPGDPRRRPASSAGPGHSSRRTMTSAESARRPNVFRRVERAERGPSRSRRTPSGRPAASATGGRP